MTEQTQSNYADLALALLRIIAGALFVQHGAQKLFGLFGGLGGSGASAQFLQLMWFAGVIEFVGGVCILLGLFTHPVAFLLSGEMAVAYFTGHATRGFWPLLNHGEPAILFCFIFLFLAVTGGGRFTLDKLKYKRKS
jgi:putative oxidoreductase